MISIIIYSRVGQDVDVRLKDGKTESVIRDWGPLKAKGSVSLALPAKQKGPWTLECRKGKKMARLLLKAPGKVEVKEQGAILRIIVLPPPECGSSTRSVRTSTIGSVEGVRRRNLPNGRSCGPEAASR